MRKVFNTPETRAKALASRRAKPHGKGGAIHTKSLAIDIDDGLPGLGPPPGLPSTPYEAMKPRERSALARMALTRMEGIVDEVFRAAREVMAHSTKDDIPRVLLINKFLDKLLPDIRTKEDAPTSSVTRVVFGAPIRRLVEAGVPVAAEVRTEAPRD